MVRSYVNMVHNIIKHIDYYSYNKNPKERKEKYKDILVSTISEYEIIIIMGYMISNPNSSLVISIEKLNLFENVKLEDSMYDKILNELRRKFNMV